MIKLILRAKSTFSPLKLDYQELLSHNNLSQKLETIFGSDGMGLIAIENVPNFQEKRSAVLPYGRRLSFLSDSDKLEITRPDKNYFQGWSQGKEGASDNPDYYKSFFQALPDIDDDIVKSGSHNPNLWPTKSLPGFESAFKALSTEMIRVGGLLSRHIDLYIKSKNPNYTKNTIEDIVANHKTSLARLLYYIPPSEIVQPWDHWHNDFGCLTALTCPMYTNHHTGEIICDSEIDEENIGLHAMNRKGEIFKIAAKPNLILYQIGEVSQIVSHGWLQATPHAVMASGLNESISRSTFAIFMQPRNEMLLEVPENCEKVFIEHNIVPTLRGRFTRGMNFGEFLQGSIKYYDGI